MHCYMKFDLLTDSRFPEFLEVFCLDYKFHFFSPHLSPLNCQANLELGPALETVRGVEGIVRSMQPQLDSLRMLVQSGGQLANKAQDQAQQAQQEAVAAATVSQ